MNWKAVAFSSSFSVPRSSFLLEARAEEEERGRDGESRRRDEERSRQVLAARVNPYGPRERGERGEVTFLQRVGEDADRKARDGVAAGVDDDDVERDGHRAHAHGDAFEQDGVE